MLRTRLTLRISRTMQLNDFTLFVAIFAATLAAVNIFNAHLNRPFILNPIENRVKYFNSKLEAVKKGLKLPFSKEKIDDKIKYLSWLNFGMKAATFGYNSIVLFAWGYYSFAVLKKNFNENDACWFMSIISTLSVVVVAIGFAIRIALEFISRIDGIQEEDSKNLQAINEQIANEKTETECF